MKLSWDKDLQSLIWLVNPVSPMTWTQYPNDGKWMGRNHTTGEILVWWPESGTILVQGKNQEDFTRRLQSAWPASPTSQLTLFAPEEPES